MDFPSANQYICRPAEEQDLSGIAELHIRCFPEYFLTKLGNVLLARYYRAYWQEAPGLFFVLERRGSKELVGFVMGYFQGSSARARFQKQCFLPLCGALLRLCLKGDRECWRRILSFIRSMGAKKTNARPEDWHASLLSIGVLEQYRGTGAAEQLVQSFEQALLQTTSPASYRLSVRRDNRCAIRFYEKLGMTAVDVSDDVTYQKQIIRG